MYICGGWADVKMSTWRLGCEITPEAVQPDTIDLFCRLTVVALYFIVSSCVYPFVSLLKIFLKIITSTEFHPLLQSHVVNQICSPLIFVSISCAFALASPTTMSDNHAEGLPAARCKSALVRTCQLLQPPSLAAITAAASSLLPDASWD